MEETLILIGKQIPEPYTIKLVENKKLITYNVFNIKEENIGRIELTRSGNLKSYTYTGKVFKHIKLPLTEESILDRTNLFLKTFVKDESLTLASVITHPNYYQVNYEEKDTKYDLYIPDTGVKIVLSSGGNILSFNKKEDHYIVVYPDEIITSQEAKSYYLKRLNLDLKVSKPANYKHYKLVYGITQEIDYLPASGEEVDSKLIIQELNSLEPFTTSSNNLFRILGLDGDYTKVGKKNKKDYRIELWSKHSKKSLIELNYDIEEPQLGIIKYKIHKHTNQIVEICDGDLLPEDMNEEITNKKALNRALDFLFTIDPKANEAFDMIDPLINGKAEVNQKHEPNYYFYFNRVHDSIEVENQIAYIGVGKYTGIINKYCAPTVTEKELAHINVFAKVSETEAKEIYANNMKMNLSFVKKIDEQENIKYELAYFPTFTGVSTAKLIDAHQGILYEA